MGSYKKLAVVGSGISGLACANILREKNYKNTLFESKNNFGGLISCSIEEGNLFHRVGGHVFNSKNNLVSEWFWNKFDKDNEFVKAKRKAVIFLNEKFINYPIELNLNQLDESNLKQIIKELIDLSSKKFYGKEKSFEEFLRNNFGPTLYGLYFEKYNKKIWSRDLRNIPLEWLEGKLPMIKPSEILFKNIVSSKVDDMVHSTFFYPKEGGSQFIVNRLMKGLKVKKTQIKNIKFQDQKILLNNDSETFDSLIYTGDARKLKNILDLDIIEDLNIKNILDEIAMLDSNSTSTMLCDCDENPYSWVYLPSEKIKPHRMIMTGNFSKNNNSNRLKSGRISCTIECSGEVKFEDFLREIEFIPFKPKYISYNFSKNSYIIQNNMTRNLIKELKIRLSKKNIFLCGRFAEWEYFNMDAAIESAIEVCNNAIK